ncbi:hypothetical protein NKH18_32925 [Streptomyces sp. M10(2022)]
MTRARVLEKDHDDGSSFLTVALVEDRIEQLPGARVALIPEIFRDERIPTRSRTPSPPPPTHRAWPRAGAGRTAPGRRCCSGRGWCAAPSRAGCPRGDTRTSSTRRTCAPVTPSRSGSTPLLRAAGETMARAVDELDARFRSSTDHDGGELFGPCAEARGWWWKRRPARLPWVY